MIFSRSEPAPVVMTWITVCIAPPSFTRKSVSLQCLFRRTETREVNERNRRVGLSEKSASYDHSESSIANPAIVPFRFHSLRLTDMIVCVTILTSDTSRKRRQSHFRDGGKRRVMYRRFRSRAPAKDGSRTCSSKL